MKSRLLVISRSCTRVDSHPVSWRGPVSAHVVARPGLRGSVCSLRLLFLPQMKWLVQIQKPA